MTIKRQYQSDDGLAELTYVKRAKTENGARPGFFWLLFVVSGLLFGLSVAYAWDAATPRHVRNFSIAGVVATAVGLVVLYQRMRVHDSLQWTEVEYERPQPAQAADYAPDEKRELTIRTNRGTATVVQPRPGAFAAWLRDATNPDNRISFSRNEGKRRDWAEWQYINLVAQLKSIGWLHPERLLNGAPDIDIAYLNEMREWLQTPIM
jgi:hypothetical protein